MGGGHSFPSHNKVNQLDNLTIIIPFFNGHKHIERTLSGIPNDIPVSIVNDMSDSPIEVNKPNVSIINLTSKGYFTGAVNEGLRLCDTDVLVLNQDVELNGTSWLDLIARNRSTYGLIGEGIKGTHPSWPKSYIHGVFMYISRDVIDRVGLMNEVDYPLWGSTCEYQLRACRNGFRALPLVDVPGLVHQRGNKNFGDSIQLLLHREPDKKQLLIRTPPAISVIVPCHNYGRYLPELIDSLMSQSFQSFDVTIADDASTDNSLEIARSLADDWKGIRVISIKKNVGTAEACNVAIRHTKGQWIARIDADDMMLPHRLEVLYRTALDNPHSIIYDDALLFGHRAHKDFPTRDNVGEYKLMQMIDYDFERLIRKNGIHCGIMFPRQAWIDTGGYPNIMNDGRDDWAFNVALGIQGYCGVKVDKPGYLYRREGQNRTLRNTTRDNHREFYVKMNILFSNIYKGERPMGCCGKGTKTYSTKVSKLNIASNQLNYPGKEGFALVEYTGRNAGNTTWFMSGTNNYYVFGNNTRSKINYVDVRDLPELLGKFDEGVKAFRRYEPKKIEIKTPVQPKVEIVKPVEETVVVDSVPPFNMSDVTISELRDKIVGLNNEQLNLLLIQEQTGSNRKGAISTLEDAVAS